MVTSKEIVDSVKRGLCHVFLLHGDNEALRADLFAEIVRACDCDLDDPFRFVRLDGDVIDSDPGRLADELGAISMFGGSRLIQLRATARQSERAVALALAAPRGDWRLVVETGDIDDAEWLAPAREQQGLLAIPCGDEHAGDFHAFVAAQFEAAGLRVEDGGIQTLISLAGDDRSAIRGEIAKLSALAGADACIRIVDIREIVADASSMLADEVAMSAFAGECDEVARILDRLAGAGSDPVQALGAAHRHALNLNRAKVKNWTPRRDGRRQPAWSAADLRQLCLSLGTAVRQTRSGGANSAVVAERALVVLARTAQMKLR